MPCRAVAKAGLSMAVTCAPPVRAQTVQQMTFETTRLTYYLVVLSVLKVPIALTCPVAVLHLIYRGAVGGLGPSGFTLREVQDFTNTWASRHPDSRGSGAENCEDALNQQTEEASSDSDKRETALENFVCMCGGVFQGGWQGHRLVQQQQPFLYVLHYVGESSGIGKWLRVEIFPKFISSPIIQRRIAQLAASRSVVNWGIDPLKSPLLTSNIFDSGCS